MNLLLIRSSKKLELLFKWAGLSPEEYDAKYRQEVERVYAKNPKPFNQWFGGKERVVVPFVRDSKKIEPPSAIVDLLERYDYRITDYEKGYCQNLKYNREEKISTAFQKIKKQVSLLPAGDEEYSDARIEGLYKQFMHDNQRKSVFAGDLVIVFSQNPHDIFRMSTNKSWTSCMECEEGTMWHTLWSEIAEGGFVAYLVRKEDVNDLDRAISRVWIRALETSDNKLWAAPETAAEYGNAPKGFVDQVQKWINKHQPVLPIGQYKRRGSIYSDTYSGNEDIFYLPEDMDNIIYSDWSDFNKVAPVVKQILQAYDKTTNPSEQLTGMIDKIAYNAFRAFNSYVSICSDIARICPWVISESDLSRFEINQLIYISNNLSEGFEQRPDDLKAEGIENLSDTLAGKLFISGSYSEDEIVGLFNRVSEPLISARLLDEARGISRAYPAFLSIYNRLKKANAALAHASNNRGLSIVEAARSRSATFYSHRSVSRC